MLRRACLEENGQLAHELTQDLARREAGESPRLPAEMGLIGIARRKRRRREAGGGALPEKRDKALESEDALQRLRPVAEGRMAAPPQAALADVEAPEERRDPAPALEGAEGKRHVGRRRIDVTGDARQAGLEPRQAVGGARCFANHLRKIPCAASPEIGDRK